MQVCASPELPPPAFTVRVGKKWPNSRRAHPPHRAQDGAEEHHRLDADQRGRLLSHQQAVCAADTTHCRHGEEAGSPEGHADTDDEGTAERRACSEESGDQVDDAEVHQPDRGPWVRPAQHAMEERPRALDCQPHQRERAEHTLDAALAIPAALLQRVSLLPTPSDGKRHSPAAFRRARQCLTAAARRPSSPYARTRQACCAR